MFFNLMIFHEFSYFLEIMGNHRGTQEGNYGCRIERAYSAIWRKVGVENRNDAPYKQNPAFPAPQTW